ncbi:MAG: TetR/AcrR family transcriptional regulator [Spirochaetaceae bacterium]|jgi:AcrR family transcriptional regulator|uniref:TetR/AcrR family transcriptional regulator n=1 Tax=Sphaerochaeta halotolerans TaxID=2293840 RepID=A0A372ME03_9SPIR|nr:TetR/AcrR family transcriptional regulator [Sphaerochaeta halotolerans]MBG0768205.1 TetR/AcrR family transcriptional regulator [Spirochaetaceae bacterium]RFU94025.1 TetR/AcrR family transcriptional regulator [Sphaerochaeta halotolerans]
MAKKSKGTSKAEATKRLIFESALTLFRQKGFNQVSIQQITDYAGTAKGSFYTYFSTKSDIIVDAFWAIDAYYRSIEDEVSREEDAAHKLLKFTELQLTYVRDVIGVEMLKVLYANQVSNEGSTKVITDQSRFWHTFIKTIIEKGQQTGEIRKDMESSYLAVLFNRAIRGLFLDWNISSAGFDLVEEGLAYCRNLLIPALSVRR